MAVRISTSPLWTVEVSFLDDRGKAYRTIVRHYDRVGIAVNRVYDLLARELDWRERKASGSSLMTVLRRDGEGVWDLTQDFAPLSSTTYAQFTQQQATIKQSIRKLLYPEEKK